jgi:hypothetical protein
MTDDSGETANDQLVMEGLARVVKQVSVDVLVSGMLDGNAIVKLVLRRCRGDDDPDTTR